MRIAALVKRIFQEVLRDKRTLAMLFLAPLLILTLMYFIFNGESRDLKIGVVTDHKQIISMLEKADMDVTEYKKETKDLVAHKKLDALLVFEKQEVRLMLKNDDLTKAKTVQIKVKQLLSALQNNSSSQINVKIKTEYVYGNSETALFDVINPILIGFFVFFFVFLISGIGLLKERTSGTLERLLATPIRRGEIVAGYLVGYGLFALLQTIIILTYSITVLNIEIVGSIWIVFFLTMLIALVALSLGLLLSTFAASEFQMMQFIPLIVIPQIFFTGILPLDGLASWVQVIGKIMPMYYAADALVGVMYKGFHFYDTIKDVIVLCVFALIFIGLNVLVLKKYRKK